MAVSGFEDFQTWTRKKEGKRERACKSINYIVGLDGKDEAVSLTSSVEHSAEGLGCMSSARGHAVEPFALGRDKC